MRRSLLPDTIVVGNLPHVDYHPGNIDRLHGVAGIGREHSLAGTDRWHGLVVRGEGMRRQNGEPLLLNPKPKRRQVIVQYLSRFAHAKDHGKLDLSHMNLSGFPPEISANGAPFIRFCLLVRSTREC